jgi:hypothetical protein
MSSLKICAPVVVTAVVFTVTLPGASVVRLVSAVPPPTMPPNNVLPESLTMSARAPFTVPRNSISAPVSVVSAPSVTASLYDCAFVVRMLPPLMAVVPPASVVRLSSAARPPTAPPNVVTPLPAFTVSAPAPFTVPLKLTAALLVVMAIGAAASETGPLKAICPVAGLALLPTAPLSVMPPAAVKFIAPATAMPAPGKVSVCAVRLRPVSVEVKPI